MSVKKGNIPWNKGKKTGPLSKKHKKKISKANKGHFISEEAKRKQHDATIGDKNPFYGKKHSIETKKKISKSHMGHNVSEETRKKIGKGNKGKKRSVEMKNKYSIAKIGKPNPTRAELNRQQVGEKHPNWLGGISFEPYTIEFNKQLKELIRHRDGYKCQKCGCSEIENIKKLAIHHIDYNKQNCLPKNLIALCNKCNAKVNKNRKKWIRYFQKKININISNSYLQLSLPIYKTNIRSEEVVKW